MARYSKTKYYTDQELEEILANSDNESVADVPYESDEATEDEMATPEPTYVPRESSDTSDNSDGEDSVDDIPLNIRKRLKGNPKKNMNDFVWREQDLKPEIHQFDSSHSGCSPASGLNANSSELDCFQQFFGEDIVQYIAEQSNIYFEFLSSQGIHPTASRLHRFNNTNYKEMYCFFAINLLMAQVKKHSINAYWTKNCKVATPIFHQIMSRDRFLLLLRTLHFVDNTEKAPEDDKLWKIRKIVDHLKKQMKETFYPFQNLCIDESLVLFKGRIFFKQYIPSKRHRFGIKFFVLCDCETGYILDFIIYTGKYTNLDAIDDELLKKVGTSGNVVLSLMKPYLGNGHSLFIDNWYVSPNLYTHLHEQKTNACGTVKKNRKGMPTLENVLERGETQYKSTTKLLALKWKDKREVFMLTTMHDSEVTGTGKIDKQTGNETKKPLCILDYNANMGAVDRSDMMLSSTECVRRTVKWYKKVFFHLLDISLLNAHALHLTVTGKKISLEAFQLKVVDQILEKYHTPIDVYRTGRRSCEEDNPLRLIARHFPSQVPPTDKKKEAQKRCVVCAKSGHRKDTRYMCSDCNAPLCIINCFERYHTVKNY